jgi:asparaginyl-tRNA synthetase
MKHYLVKELYTQIPQQDVAEVKVNGWVRTMRESKTFAFVELNDGTYFRNLQVILEEAKLNNYREATRQIGVGERLVLHQPLTGSKGTTCSRRPSRKR